MRGFNIYKDLVQVIQELYGNATSAVLLNGQRGGLLQDISGCPSGSFALSSPVQPFPCEDNAEDST
ncbi:hypothetical protein DPMN_127091 [Dreissena polymorpha]|uniref:Uncharacterized protein n=1 Tax=Dreissena polymorpha TaxID=45954 RepID=A0A9D4JYI9_DREPO|nr:hypothetical protein DPMN_127091 [Dreissena polymorpha]